MYTTDTKKYKLGKKSRSTKHREKRKKCLDKLSLTLIFSWFIQNIEGDKLINILKDLKD
jgi:hypothetical protein